MNDCQYAIKCPHCYITEGFDACARYKLAGIIGIYNVPHWLGAIDYARLPELIKEFRP